MGQYTDRLQKLKTGSTIQSKLQCIHQTLRTHNPAITRIAVALYDSDSGELSTFTFSSDHPSPLTQYQIQIDDVPSLKQLMAKGASRVVEDIPNEFVSAAHSKHSQAIINAGYLSSYTFPMVVNDSFLGFIFFDAEEKRVFNADILPEVTVSANLIALLIYNEFSTIQSLIATLRCALIMTHSKDPETAGHQERMAHYSRLIARELAGTYDLDDEYIEHIYLFAPLHDIGKLKVRDSILQKRGPLIPEERREMERHSGYGLDLVEALLQNHGLDGLCHATTLRNIILYHHEKMDGKGYPEGLTEASIPLESRIVCVADVFDALTSERPYKQAWSNQHAVKELRTLAGTQLDAECVEALVKNLPEVERIQSQFQDELLRFTDLLRFPMTD